MSFDIELKSGTSFALVLSSGPPPAGVTINVKIAGTFVLKPLQVKIGGTFVDPSALNVI